MTRFITAISMMLIILALICLNRSFINELYDGMDARLEALENSGIKNDAAIDDLYGYWSGKTRAASLSVKESELRGMTLLISRLKSCEGEEYKASLSDIRQLLEELRKTESMAFFDLF